MCSGILLILRIRIFYFSRLLFYINFRIIFNLQQLVNSSSSNAQEWHFSSTFVSEKFVGVTFQSTFVRKKFAEVTFQSTFVSEQCAGVTFRSTFVSKKFASSHGGNVTPRICLWRNSSNVSLKKCTGIWLSFSPFICRWLNMNWRVSVDQLYPLWSCVLLQRHVSRNSSSRRSCLRGICF